MIANVEGEEFLLLISIASYFYIFIFFFYHQKPAINFLEYISLILEKFENEERS